MLSFLGDIFFVIWINIYASWVRLWDKNSYVMWCDDGDEGGGSMYVDLETYGKMLKDKEERKEIECPH